MSKISIVSAYYNRKEALLRTIKTIEKSAAKDIEFIIVDDGSDDHHRLEDYANKFNFIKLVRIEPEDKKHINPCVPYNLGFSKVTGDIVIIQSPECFHMGDVISFVEVNAKANKYLVFCCYSISEATSNRLNGVSFDTPLGEFEPSVVEAIGEFRPDSTINLGKGDSWFVHPVYRPAHYNFLTAITTKDLDDLGGFDESFANGYAYDDTEFAERITKKKMDIKFVEKPFCIHSPHGNFPKIMNLKEKEAKNRALYKARVRSNEYKVTNSFLKEK